MVPTSQIYLSRAATLGTEEINAYRARVVWDYWRHDVKPTHTVPATLARYFVEQLPLAALPQSELQQRLASSQCARPYEGQATQHENQQHMAAFL